MEMEKMWGDLILSSLPLEERLKGLEPEEIEAYLRKIKKTH